MAQPLAKDLWELVTGNDNDMIKIHLLGVPQKPLTVHRKVLVTHSPYFQKLLATNGTGDQTLDGIECLHKSAHLNTPQPFELFVQYLYTGRIDEVPSKDSAEAPRYNLFDYIRLWILGDHAHFQIPRLQLLALQRVEEYYHQRQVQLNSQQVKYIYANTSTGSELRRLAAEEAIHEFMKDDSEDVTSSHVAGELSYECSPENGDFACDMLAAAKRGISKGWPHPFKRFDVEELTPPHSPDVDVNASAMGSPPELSHETRLGSPSHDLLNPVTPRKEALKRFWDDRQSRIGFGSF